MRGPKEKQNSRYNKRQLHDICIFRVWQRLVWKWLRGVSPVNNNTRSGLEFPRSPENPWVIGDRRA